MSGLNPCCISGAIAEGTPAGKDSKLGGVATYIATPPTANSRAVVICSDVFGYQLPNTRLIADALAKAGFLTVIPDMFDGQPVDASVMETMVVMALGERSAGSSTWASWLGSPFRTIGRIAHVIYNLLPIVFKHFPPQKKVPLIEAVISDLKSDHGVKSVGVVGYCYGAGPALKLATGDAVDAFAIAHGGGIKVPQDLDPLKKPGLIICADHDDQFPEKTRKQAEQVLSARKDVPFSVKFYPGTFHGFAIRGDDKDSKIAEAKVDATQQIVDWMNVHLKA